MLEIDGSEGGGQILRSSLALAAIAERPIRLRNIRGNRPEPGLKSQHLTAVETLAAITGATVDGATIGSRTIIFDPETASGGQFTAEIGTAGSVSLLFDTLLPLAVAIDEPLSVTASGGTEVKWSPPLLAHQHVKLPLCRRFGVQAAIERHRSGFYPSGGGRATLHLVPASLSSHSILDRGELIGARCYSLASTDLEESNVAKRQAETARDRISARDIEVIETQTIATSTRSTGTALVVELEYEHSRAGFDALGEPGLPAEEVAEIAVEDALQFQDGSAAVDRHLADQLLVFLALAGGRLRVPTVTEHIETSLGLLDRFGYELTVDRSGDEPTIEVG